MQSSCYASSKPYKEAVGRVTGDAGSAGEEGLEPAEQKYSGAPAGNSCLANFTILTGKGFVFARDFNLDPS